MQIADISFDHRFDPMIVTLFISTILSFIAATVRISTRVWWVKQPGTDDAFIASALVATIAYLVAALHLIEFTQRMQNEPSLTKNYLEALWATILTYTLTHFSFKFAILFQGKRIFIDPRAQRFYLGLIVYLATYCIICTLLTIISCWPVEKYWDPSIPGGCIDSKAAYDAFAGINIVNDLAILLAPMPFVKGLNMARKTKFALIGLLACGGIACVFAAVRAYSLYDNSEDDAFRGTTKVCIWSALEINIAIICACVPVLRQLLVDLSPHLRSFALSSTRGNRTYRTTVSTQMGGTKDEADGVRGKRGDDIEARASRFETGLQQSVELDAVIAAESDASSQRDLVTDRDRP